jgi:hypothetical protein
MTLRDVLDEIARARKAHEHLLPLLMEELPSSRLVPPPNADSWLSVSRVPSVCPRALVIASRLGLQLSDDIDTKGRWLMDRGSAMHTVFQALWLGPMGWLKGGWVCPHCAHLHGGVGEDRWSVRLENAVVLPECCERCGAAWRRQDPFAFVEPYSAHPEPLKVKGRNDGFLCLPACGIEVMDLKFTTRLDLVRETPNPEHVEQVQWYMDTEKLRSGRIVYVDPGAKLVENAMVEHRVNFSIELMNKQKEKVRAIREALKESSRPVPACPYGGEGTYRECNCVEMEVLWVRAGH